MPINLPLGTPGPATSRKRSWPVTGLLSLIAPGAGHVYVGHAKRGFGWLVAVVAVDLLGIAVAFALPPTFAAYATFVGLFLILTLALSLALIVDAVRIARRDSETPRARWYVVLGAIVVVYVVSTLVGILYGALKPYFPWELFNVASSSMTPAFPPGDIFMVDKQYYDDHAPQHGDVVVYVPPKDPHTIYIKRIVAVAGERVSFDGGRAIVNGKPLDEPYADLSEPDSFINKTQEFTVPAGDVFVAGDNRKNSMDSRMWTQHGPVPVANLRGRATQIMWSSSLRRIGTWVGSAS
jgi:signal peptidase I